MLSCWHPKPPPLQRGLRDHVISPKERVHPSRKALRFKGALRVDVVGNCPLKHAVYQLLEIRRGEELGFVFSSHLF